MVRRVSESAKALQIAFIHSRLDEAGLTPVQFRVYCHISRRGECFASAETIAQNCRVNRDSVWPAVTALEGRGMIEVVHRVGRTTVYRTTPMSAWKGYPAEKRGQVNPAESKGHPVAERMGREVAERSGHPPGGKEGPLSRSPEVNPSKLIHGSKAGKSGNFFPT